MAAVAGTESGQGVLGVRLDGFLADPKLASRGGRRASVGQQLEDLPLALGQLAPASLWRNGRIDEAFVCQRRLCGLAQMLCAGGAGDEGGGSGLQGGHGDVALGPVAVGDDSQRRLDFAQLPDRLVATEAVAVGIPAQVDDCDVEAADVLDQREALLSGLALMDLEAVLERIAQANSNDRVTVDDKTVWTFAQGSFRSARGREIASPGLLSPELDPSPAGPGRAVERSK